MKNGHGLCHDTQGNIYFTFEPEQVEERTRCLVRFAPDGTEPVLLGADNTLAHGVPHGLNIPFSLNGAYHSTIEAREITAPCNADVRGDYLLVPDLDGPLVILDRENRVVSVIQVGQLLGSSGFRHPHDAIWLPNGDIAVCTWNPGRLGYWRRLGTEPPRSGA